MGNNLLTARQRREQDQMVVSPPSQNLGKGAAIRTALGIASSDVSVIHDADLEWRQRLDIYMACAVAVSGRQQGIESLRVHPGLHLSGRQAAIPVKGRGWDLVQLNAIGIELLYAEAAQ